MKLYLVRHGIAVEKLGGAIRFDSQRPLTDEGIAETKQVAHATKKLGVGAQLVITSPLVRAKQTGEIFKNELNVAEDLKVADALSPAGNPKDVFKYVKQYDSLDEIILVGHEPDMGRLLATLLWAGLEVEIPFKKAGICRVDVNDVPPTFPGVLKWFITPKIAALMVK